MVGRNGLFSGYKSQRTKGHRGAKRKKERADFRSPGFFSKKQRRRTNRGSNTKKTKGTGRYKKKLGERNRGETKKKTVKNNASRTQRKNPEKGGITEKPLVITEPGERRK
jgi:hypothetical protein